MHNKTRELQKYSAALDQANVKLQYALGEKEIIQNQLKSSRAEMIQMEANTLGLKNDRDSNANRIGQL